MNRGSKRMLAALMVAILLLTGAALTVAHWLPRLAGLWLPEGTKIAMDGSLRWKQGHLHLPGASYFVGDCQLAKVENATLGYQQGRWQASAGRVTLDNACLASLPDSHNNNAPRTLTEWQQMLPSASVNVDNLLIKSFPQWAGALSLTLDPARQQLSYRGDNVTLALELEQQQLRLQHFSANLPGLTAPVSLSGTFTLPSVPDSLPLSGELKGGVRTDSVPEPLSVQLSWQEQQGILQVYGASQSQPLLYLPWRVSDQQISVQQGSWRWPWGTQPLSGGVTLLAERWKEGLDVMQLSGRLNVVTSGRGGKGNAVLSVGPGRLGWQDSALPLRLNGEAKLAALQFYARLNGALRGPLADPRLDLLPGALLRMKGKLLTGLEVDEARWPLAGVNVSSSGINGRLQAILSAHGLQKGNFRLHLDGRASNFFPDRGDWQWRYWGEGRLKALSAKWDVRGHGRWTDALIELSALSTGFDRLRYGSVTVTVPRLTLIKPLRWQRDAAAPIFGGELALKAQETRFSAGGYLPPATLTLSLQGKSPNDFNYRGSLNAKKIGPVRINGRWDGERLRGQVWWPEQSLRVFQPLIAPDLKLNIAGGTLRAQAAFSASAEQGLEAGGHWLVQRGEAQLPDNTIRGVNFSLPFRLAAHRWYFGTHGPVSLQIDEIKNQFVLQNVSAELRGWYPWSAAQPLTLSSVRLELLGGTLSLDWLQMPQTAPARLRIKHIALSQLVTAMKVKQIALSGHVSGELPLWLNNSRWLIKEGWVANDGPLTVRMDKDMADAISSNNIAAAAATDWLRYMEISRSQATLSVDNLGWMSLSARVNGTSRFSDRDQRVTLNYSQKENVFQLWRSLRFGDNLQSWVEDNATLPSQKEKRDEISD